MIIGLALVVGLMIAWALGARLSMLAELRFRGDALVFASLAVQLAVFTPLRAEVPNSYVVPLHLLSYALIFGFFVLNLRVPGFWLVGFGVISNLVVIVANGGRMPVSLETWRATGGDVRLLVQRGFDDNNVLAGPGTHLGWLGDVFALPSGVPFAAAISIGDIAILLGMVAFVYRACAPRPAGRPVSLLAPLRWAAFRRVVAGRMVSGVGDWLTQAAVVTWLYQHTHSTYLISVFLVGLILSITTGGLASAPLLDRIGSFRVLSWVEGLRGGLTLLLIPAAVGGQVYLVIAICALSSFLSAATKPSAAGLVPDVLPPELLQAGNAVHNLAPSINSIIGAAAGGFLVIQFGIGIALAVDLATFIAAAALYRSFSGLTAATQPRSSGDEPRVSRRTLLRSILRSRVVFSVTASFAFATGAFGLMNAVTAPLFDDRYHQPNAYGFVAAMIGVGYLFGEALTGHVRRHAVVRRSVSVAFLITAAAAYLLADAPTATTAFLAAFMLGAADGVTEVAHDTLIQLNTPRELRAGVFAMANSIERGGMVLGVLAAPLLLNGRSPETVVRLSTGLLLVGAGIAAIGLVRRIATDEALDEKAAGAEPGSVGHAVSAFELSDGDHEPVPVAGLATSGAVALVVLGRSEDRERESMVRELADGLRESAFPLVVVAEGSAIAERLAASRTARVLEDPSGAAHRALGIPVRGLRRRSRGGAFVIDAGLVVRFAFVPTEDDQWIPASFVLGRMARMAPAAPLEVQLLRTDLRSPSAGPAPASDSL
jgi:predicted MFS family arabinose efflux permease